MKGSLTTNVRNRLVAAGIVLGSLGVGALFEVAFGEVAADEIVSTNLEVDPRVIVVDLSEEVVDDTGGIQSFQGFASSALASVAAESGATTVGLVEFESLAFPDGGSGRAIVIASDAMQNLGVVPLLDVAIKRPNSSLPILTNYRVDQLSSEVAGIGLPLIDSQDVLRVVPALGAVSALENGAIVHIPESQVDDVARQLDHVVPGMSMRLVELGVGEPIVRASMSEMEIGDMKVPLEDGSMRVRWSDELDDGRDVAVISYADLASHSVDRTRLENSIVLVGTLDPAHTSLVDTPIGALPPVLIQANAVNTLLTRAWMRPASTLVSMLAALVGACAIALMRRTRWRVILACLIVVGWMVAVRLLSDRGTLVQVLPVPVTATIAALLFEVVRQLHNLGERRRLRELFSQYVSPGVAEQLVSSQRGTRAQEGERLTITALFCDLRGFTPLAAALEPSMVRQLLNAYYEEIGAVAFDAGGTVMQYTGDEIFVVFGAPIPMDNHASAAILCARAMFGRLDHLNQLLVADGLPPITFGIGIHSGDVVAAHVGSSFRMQYSVIGDAVNVASRHVSAAAAGQIVISESSIALTSPPADGETIMLQLKGIDGQRLAHVVTAGRAQATA